MHLSPAGEKLFESQGKSGQQWPGSWDDTGGPGRDGPAGSPWVGDRAHVETGGPVGPHQESCHFGQICSLLLQVGVELHVGSSELEELGGHPHSGGEQVTVGRKPPENPALHLSRLTLPRCPSRAPWPSLPQCVTLSHILSVDLESDRTWT